MISSRMRKPHPQNSFILLSCGSVFVNLCAAADPIWEPAKVVAVEQVSTPAKEPDPSCRSLPKGATPPARCRPSNLRAEQFCHVTVDVGNKRFVVRPYRAAKLLDTLNQDGTDYVDPHLTIASSIEAAIVSTKSIRLRTDQGQGIPAIVDSQELRSASEVAPRADVPEPVRQNVTPSVASGSKVILLENSDFVELELQEARSQEIGDGAAVYSFTGNAFAGPSRIKPARLSRARGKRFRSGGKCRTITSPSGQGNSPDRLFPYEEPLSFLDSNFYNSRVRDSSEN
jgi:hypothetical protein